MYRPSRLKDIERSKEALISHYSFLVPSSLQELSPEERRRVYRMMHLRVSAHRDDTLIADGGVMTSHYLDGVPHIQHLPSGFVSCLLVMAAKRPNWRSHKRNGVQGRLS